LYFNEGRRGNLQIAQMAVTGGQISNIPTPLIDAQPAGIAPDGSYLLVFQGGVAPPSKPIWKVPLPTGDPVRLGNLKAQDGSVTPDGHILLGERGDLYILDADGSNMHKIVGGLKDFVGNSSMSPDGKQIVFSLYRAAMGGVDLWAVNRDGSGLHQVASNPEGFCCSSWTTDSRYIIFETRATVMQSLWYLPMRRSWWERAAEPKKLTAVPLSLHDSVPSRDGKTIFALGTKERGELVRYDMRTKQFIPFLGGVSASDAAFSKDGKWAIYRSFPDGTLWRSRVDGTERLQLSYGAVGETISFTPDGKDVTYDADGKIYMVGLDGGEPKALVDDGKAALADWSPEGDRILFNSGGQISVLDGASGQKTTYDPAGSLWGTRWIGRDQLVGPSEHAKFKLFDLKKGTWSDWLIEPAPRAISRWGVSPDHQYLYYATGGPEPALMRVRYGEHRSEQVASLKDFHFAMFVQVNGGDVWISFAPDGSPLLVRDTGSQEVYALTVRWP
jgi:Tol biopolymer transport system component